ncbi:MAG: hypothetical protein GY838_03790 [bacterium]|nr:hypothetical protein [bacterium]
MGSELTQTTFDYQDTPKVTVRAMEASADRIEKAQAKVRKAAAEGVIALGKELAKARARLVTKNEDGESAGGGRNSMFSRWLKERCGIPRQTAYEAMAVAEAFVNCTPGVQLFHHKALVALSANSCPEEATAEALKLAEQGEQITHKRAKAIIAEFTVDEDNGEPEPDDDTTEPDVEVDDSDTDDSDTDDSDAEACPKCGGTDLDAEDGVCAKCFHPTRFVPPDPPDDEDEDQPRAAQHREPSAGLMQGTEAVNCLKRIPFDDPTRERGFQIVEGWITDARSWRS